MRPPNFEQSEGEEDKDVKDAIPDENRSNRFRLTSLRSGNEEEEKNLIEDLLLKQQANDGAQASVSSSQGMKKNAIYRFTLFSVFTSHSSTPRELRGLKFWRHVMTVIFLFASLYSMIQITDTQKEIHKQILNLRINSKLIAPYCNIVGSVFAIRQFQDQSYAVEEDYEELMRLIKYQRALLGANYKEDYDNSQFFEFFSSELPIFDLYDNSSSGPHVYEENFNSLVRQILVQTQKVLEYLDPEPLTNEID